MSGLPKGIVFVEFCFKQETVLAARKLGYKTVLFQQKPMKEKKAARAAGLFDKVIFYKSVDLDQLKIECQNLKKELETMAVLTNYEEYVVERSLIATYLGLPGYSVEAGLRTRNKLLQRKALKVLPENIDFAEINRLEDLANFYEQHDGDIFLKNLAGVKGRHIVHLKGSADLEKEYQDLLENLRKKTDKLHDDFSFLDLTESYPDPKKVLLAEKAEKGRQLTVLTLLGINQIWHAPDICDVYTAQDIGREDSFLAFRILPSNVEEASQQELKQVTTRIVKQLAIRNCGIHAEFFQVRPEKWKLIELASRIGGYREKMYQEVYGFSVSELLIRVLVGEELETLQLKPRKYVSYLEIFAKESGELVSVDGEESLQKDQSVKYLTRIRPGKLVGRAQDGYKPVLTFMISGDSYNDVWQRSLFYQEKLQVIIKKLS